ncbi:hypothetical protein GOODEAATRI_022824 [Goodea atripinnis]|uniref:Uncharacterized protein n=1 Tax=Goodea atripinnis TaxID=208336 RepID=A0ABV0N3L7_9TELE
MILPVGAVPGETVVCLVLVTSRVPHPAGSCRQRSETIAGMTVCLPSADLGAADPRLLQQMTAGGGRMRPASGPPDSASVGAQQKEDVQRRVPLQSAETWTSLV